MANMSYCRFHNTALAVQDCIDHLNDDLSPDEVRAKKKLVTHCDTLVMKVEEEEN